MTPQPICTQHSLSYLDAVLRERSIDLSTYETMHFVFSHLHFAGVQLVYSQLLRCFKFQKTLY